MSSNTDPVIISAAEKELYDVIGLWTNVNETVNENAAQENENILQGIPDEADWALMKDYSNTTSPLNYSDMIFAAITTLDGDEYYFNLSSRIRFGGNPNTSLFTLPENSTGNATFYVDGAYAFYGLLAEMEVIVQEALRFGVFS